MNTNKATNAEEQQSVRLRNLQRDEFRVDGELGAQRMTGTTVTRYELIQLVKYWDTYYLDEDFFNYWTEQYSSSSSWRMNYSQDRIREISETIGEALTQAAIDEATEEFGASLDPRVWNLYQNGHSLPPAVALKMNTGKKVTEADWRASYKKPEVSSTVQNKRLTRGRRLPD